MSGHRRLSEFCEALRAAVVADEAALPEFDAGSVAVVATEGLDAVEARVAESARAGGLALVIYPPVATVPGDRRDAPGPVSDVRVLLVVSFDPNRVASGLGEDATAAYRTPFDAAEALYSWLHLRTLQDTVFKDREIRAVSMTPAVDDGGALFSYDIEAELRFDHRP